MSLASWEAQKRGWAMLKALHPAEIDLQRIALLRDAPLQDLSDHEKLGSLLLKLGLNDEGMQEFPAFLHEFCGHGLRLWQYPNQYSKYLVQISKLNIRSYLEIGIRHGGSFVITTEYLRRFAPLNASVGVDIIPCPSMSEYNTLNPGAHFHAINTQSDEFAQLLNNYGSFDLVFIDSHHEEIQCRREVAFLEQYANIVALHDISNVACPGVAKVWEELKSRIDLVCFEYVDQYLEDGPYMGIGLAIKLHRFNDAMSSTSAEAEATP